MSGKYQELKTIMKKYKLPSASEIKKMRESKRLSVYQVEKETGINRGKISRIEEGYGVSYFEVIKLIEFYQA